MVRVAGDNWSRRLLTRLFDLAGKLSGGDPMLPPFSMRRFVGEARWDFSGKDFRNNGLHFAEKLIADAALGPNSRVLVIGSGCGRIAVPLTKTLGSQVATPDWK